MKALVVNALGVAVAALLVSAASRMATIQGAERPQSTTPASSQTRRAEGLEAWGRMYSVLSHPRCINCHTATNYPQQGDDRHRHQFNVVRGREDRGAAGFTCAACHQGSNADSTGVPGAHNWQLAPLSMRWQDRSDRILPSSAVCQAVTDQSRNHHLDGPGLLKHHEDEALVRWAFQPGRRNDGSERSLPPLTHEQFVAATRTWVEAGSPCPPR